MPSAELRKIASNGIVLQGCNADITHSTQT
jgi:hypothetical protein